MAFGYMTYQKIQPTRERKTLVGSSTHSQITKKFEAGWRCIVERVQGAGDFHSHLSVEG